MECLGIRGRKSSWRSVAKAVQVDGDLWHPPWFHSLFYILIQLTAAHLRSRAYSVYHRYYFAMENTEKAPAASRLRTKPTPEQIASLREERERKRQLKAEEEQAKLQLYGNPLLVAADDPRGAIMDRKWVDLTSMTQGSSTTQRVRIKTWNVR